MPLRPFVDIRDVAPGLWIWRVDHPHWKPGQGWKPRVSSTCVESGGARPGRNETPLWLPEQRVIVFADALTAPEGELRVWASPSHELRALPALRALLDLPFEQVIVSHGDPVHSRAAYERALDLPPWTGEPA